MFADSRVRGYQLVRPVVRVAVARWLQLHGGVQWWVLRCAKFARVLQEEKQILGCAKDDKKDKKAVGKIP